MLNEKDYVKQIDPAIDLTRPVKIRIEEGAQNVTVTKYPASSVSPQNIQFNNVNPNSAETIVDRKLFVKASFRLTFLGTNVPSGEFLLQTDGISEYGTPQSGSLVGGVDGLRAFPLSQMLASIQLKMNNQTFTQNINEYIEPLMRYSNYRDVGAEDWSMTPTMQDQYQNYSDFAIYGSARNSLGNYGENGHREPRGGFSGLVVVSQNRQGFADGTASTGLGDVMEAVVDVQITEPIFISPLAFGKRSHRGFVGVKTMALTLNIDSQYQNYIWSHDETSSGKTINNISLSFNTTSTGYANRPELLFTYYTPRMFQKIPENNLYPYHQITDYTFDLNGSLNPGQEQQISVNNIQLDSVPKRVFIFLRTQSGLKTFNDTDSYARIQGINMTFSNQSGLLSDASEQQLYEMSVRNGLKMSWSQWSKFCGSVLCLDFSKQISMDNKNVVGKNGSYQIQYRLNIKNVATSSRTYTVHTVVVNDGYVNVIEQSLDVQNNLGDVDKVYDSPNIHTIDWEDFEMFYGAGLADKLKKYGKKEPAREVQACI